MFCVVSADVALSGWCSVQFMSSPEKFVAVIISWLVL